MRWTWTGRAMTATAAACALLVGGAVAWAMAMPTSNGAIDGCYNTNRGTVRLLVEAGDACDSRETAISFLGALAKASDSDRLDGLDSTAFQLAGSKASDSDRLDGLDSTAFQLAGGKASDSDTLDGLDSTAFQLAGSKASDSDKLDGLDSTAFYAAGSTVANSLALRGHAPSAFLGTTVYVVTKGVAGGAPDSAVTSSVACLAGDRALAGGFSDLDRTTFVEASRPGLDGSSWQLKWWNGAAVDALTIWVSCSQART